MLPCFVISRRHPPRLPRHCRGASRGPSSLLSLSGSPRITLVGILLSHNPLRCNTYAPPRKCCKQKTYGPAKPFRCNTYKKQGEGVPIMVNQVLEKKPPSFFPRSVSLRLCGCHVFHSYENCRGVYQQFPKWNIPAHARTELCPLACRSLGEGANC